MSTLGAVVLLSLLPGLGNFAGGMAAELVRSSPRMLNWALHAAAGIVLAIVSVELIPTALHTLGGVWLALALAAGGLAYVAIEYVVERGRGDGRNGVKRRTGMWMIYIAVAIDLSSDGLMIGTGSAVSFDLALVLAAGQVLADIPEGYASVANFKANGVPRARRVALSASFILFCAATALLTFFLLRGAGEPVKMAALMFGAGLLILAAVEDMLEEAHESREDTRLSVLFFLAGFVLFTLVSVGLESWMAARP